MQQSMTLELALKRIAELEAQNKAKATGSIKVSKSGGVSVYGLGRFPVTLYKSQWEALFARIPDIQAFIAAHESELASKETAQSSEETTAQSSEETTAQSSEETTAQSSEETTAQ